MKVDREISPNWVDKYRPKKVADTILPTELKNLFQSMVSSGNVQNMLLAGPPGIGKTTSLLAMVTELGSDYIFVNGSLKGDINTLRSEIHEFVSTVSFVGGRKYVILDEADNLTHATQLALRSFIENYNKSSFLLTCNHPHRIEEALRSRCAFVPFKIPKGEGPALAKEMFVRAKFILQDEKVDYDKAALVEVVKRFFPDFRKTLNELQAYAVASGNKIDPGIVTKLNAADMTTLVKDMKDKNFTNVRKWAGENSEHDAAIFKKLYDKAAELVTPQSIPALVVLLADYDYRSAFVADKEINLAACLAAIMADVEFK